MGPADQEFVAVSSTNRVIIASFTPTTSGLPKPTVVRTRGMVTVRPAVGVFGDIQIVGAYGLAVVSTRAFTAGATSIPGPFDDAGWDGWFVWQSFGIAYESGSAIGVENFATNIEVDSKAMRKIGDEETIVLMAESQTGAFQISMPVRMLLKLS